LGASRPPWDLLTPGSQAVQEKTDTPAIFNFLEKLLIFGGKYWRIGDKKNGRAAKIR
jgi:hypothetical protein